MTTPERLLIIGNDLSTVRPLRSHLSMQFPFVSVAFDSVSALKDIAGKQVDFIILEGDSLPDRKGISLVQEIRNITFIPIIYLSGSSSSSDRIRILETGADDHLSKNIDLRELTARIHAIWRRYITIPHNLPVANTEKKVSYNHLEISLTNYRVIYRGEPLEMPPKELELFYFLASSPNQVFTREQLLNRIWGYDYLGEPRTVDVHIKRIREKLSHKRNSAKTAVSTEKKDHETWSLDTVWGVGYKFSLASSDI